MTQEKKKTGWAIIRLGCGCLVFVVLVAIGIYLYAGWLSYKEAPMIVEVQEYNPQLEDPYPPMMADIEICPTKILVF